MNQRSYKKANLPPRMRARHRPNGVTYYYYDLGGKPRKEKALGTNYVVAMREWAKLEQTKPIYNPTFNDAVNTYRVDVLPYKSNRSQEDNLNEFPYLIEFFGDAPLEEIKPLNIRQYLNWRCNKAKEWLERNNRKITPTSGQVRANREISLFSHIFNHARETGLTNAPNPCLGVSKFSEKGRDVYVEDDTYMKVWKVAQEPLRDAMDLAYLTGQRPADTVSMSEHDIKDGYLHIKQGKSGAKIRIAIEGELAAVLERIRKRRSKFKIVSARLVVSKYGKPVVGRTVSAWLQEARKKVGVTTEEFQFRDLRAKAGTDKDDAHGIAAAKDQLGHKSERMTAHYIRHRRGKKVSPTR